MVALAREHPGSGIGRKASQQGDQMSRNRILAAGALLWTAVAVDGLIHIATGDWLAPALMAITGIAWVAVRWPRRAKLEAA